MKKRALIHVENTQQLEELAKYLDSSGWQILSANKTENFLRNMGIPVQHVSALDQQSGKIPTDFSYLQRDLLSYQETDTSFDDTLNYSQHSFNEQGNGISLVCMNFYPTLHAVTSEVQVKKSLLSQNFFATAVLRTAFVNASNVLLLTDPTDYKEAITQLKTDSISDSFRNYLAAKAINLISCYDSGIAYSVLNSPLFVKDFMNHLTVPYGKHSLRQGSNSQQNACIYSLPNETGLISGLSKNEDPKLDFNIISDISLAWELISNLYKNLKDQYSVPSTNASGYDFSTQFTPLTGTVFTIAIKFNCVIGAALSSNAIDSFQKTYLYDKEIEGVSLGCSSVVDKDMAQEIINGNFAAIVAPGFTEEAEQILSTKPEIKLISNTKVFCSIFDGRIINGGILLQHKDTKLFEHWQVATRNRPDQELIDQMAFGTLLTLASRSYSAIVLKENHIIAIAQSCTTNKGAVQNILDILNYINGSGDILVSDSPIKYTDAIKKVIEKGIKAIIQPGGIPDDKELTEFCDEKGIVMILTNMTHITF